MEFRTKVAIEKSGLFIGYGDGIVMLGSCFTENIGARLSCRLMDVCVNPFGTLYNPASIADAVERLAENRMFTAGELFEYGGRWHSFAHHSRFSSADREKALERINSSYAEAVAALRRCSVLIVTFGTAYVFTRDGRVVANCHKLPASEFARTMLGIDEITEIWDRAIQTLGRLNPQMRILFTVSPVRHLADGAHGNQSSKATLLLATDSLVERFGQCGYFPSYEIMMDELRDYRFYASDITHPSEMAVDYIMERFSDAYFTEETRRQADACMKLSRMVNHRPMSDNAVEVRRFREAVEAYAGKLSAEFPCLAPRIAVALAEWKSCI